MARRLSQISVFLCAFFAFLGVVSAQEPAKPGIIDELQEDIDASADSLSFLGSNIVAKGNVVIRYKEYTVEADKAIVNISSKDIEAVGNVNFINRVESRERMTLRQYMKFRHSPDKMMFIDGYVVTPVGEQLLMVKTTENSQEFKAEKIVGNLNSGAIEFKDFDAHVDQYYCRGLRATRSPDGVITVNDASLTTCEYAQDNHEHYSIGAGTVKMYPHTATALDSAPDLGAHTIWAYNCVIKAMGVPVMWMPAMYKPSDEEWGFFQVKGGKDSDWGYFVMVSKKFRLFDYPDTTAKFMVDFYSERGVAAGVEVVMRTERTYTEIFAYGLRDRKPYGPDDDGTADYLESTDRIAIPKNRYELKLTHMNHVTPRFDFRGQIDKLSDINFLDDYFGTRYDKDPQPMTFGSLEYQFDRLTAELFFRTRVNNFFSEVERMPELKFNLPRQELFYNLYHEGQASISNLYMKWRDYDQERTTGNGVDPKNYNTWRMDSVNNFYYPFSLDWLNLIPRGGVRLTYYSKTSDTPISTEDLDTMFIVDSPDGQQPGDVINYDSQGGSKVRFAGELGLEMNTKIYRSWQDAKNAFWQLDGLRHVFTPYTNYTFLPKPTLDRKYIYYFDDIDRIDRQNFVRLGIKNDLETRRGDYGAEQIYNWLSIENYIDYHFQHESGFKNLGDLGTILKFTPFENLTVTSVLLLDTGQNSDHDAEAMRGNPAHAAGRPGISSKWINKWETSVSYNITEDIKAYMNYNYQDAYKEQSAYSMGSTLQTIDASSSFTRAYSRSQTVGGGLEFPIPIDNKTFGAVEGYYDFEVGYIREVKAKLIRRLHCWEAAVEVGQEISRDSTGDKLYKKSIMLAVYLTAMPSVKLSQRAGVGGSGGGGGD